MEQKAGMSVRAAVPTLLLSALLAASCAAAGMPSAAKTPSEPVAPPSDLTGSVQIVQRALAENRPDLLRALIGDEGVAAAPYAVGAQYEGHDNSDEIVAAFSDALERSKPACVGYDPQAGSLPDKAILVYRGLSLDWSRFGLSGVDSAGATIQLFHLPEGWRFVYITPFDLQADSATTETFLECPSD